MPTRAIVYSQEGCPACHEAIEYLSRKGADVVVKDIRRDPAALQELLDQGYRATPIVQIEGVTIVGHDPAQIDAALGAAALPREDAGTS